MADSVLRIGVVGLSRGFDLMRGAFAGRPRCELVAAADPRPEACAAFAAEFGGRAWPDAEALCADSDVDAVYVATPHQLHAEHAILAARRGKHVLLEKPMALSLEDCDAIAAAVRAAGVALVCGPSHSFDPPIAAAAAMIASGEYGKLRMITAVNFTDFLYRPRTPLELTPEAGGGVLFSQAVHHADVLRRLAGAEVDWVFAQAGAWDRDRPVDGAYQALLGFADGASASVVYSGHARYDTDSLMGWVGETGRRRNPEEYGRARQALAATPEAFLKAQRAYGGSAAATESELHEHFGLLIASCERADLRPTPGGVEIWADEAMRLAPTPPSPTSRECVLDELWSAVVEGRAPVHDAAWGRANLAVCLAMR
ncbi:MAG TPA: Gfo/Idh/MocA family oxidoreductase, partial [Caulobacteraceae bacterium]|nr:Gfo/Idh/MocA family oxidoreductase [Caulobacteraceae bacterium]